MGTKSALDAVGAEVRLNPDIQKSGERSFRAAFPFRPRGVHQPSKGATSPCEDLAASQMGRSFFMGNGELKGA
jgi:hypothetical protein